MAEGRRIEVQKIPRNKPGERDWENLIAEFCYHFNQYRFDQARKLPFRRIVQMLRVARRIQAAQNYNFTQIAAAPHSKKGAMVKKLLDHYKKEMN